MWRTTRRVSRFQKRVRKFQSTSPVWRTTRSRLTTLTTRLNFNPRPPCGGRPVCRFTICVNKKFQSTSPVWRTTIQLLLLPRTQKISIHVPRVEDDTKRTLRRILRYISIHVPRVEDDSCGLSVSRPPRYFNPRPPCGGRRRQWKTAKKSNRFQSTSPVWRTTFFMIFSFKQDLFQSTSPVWRTT